MDFAAVQQAAAAMAAPGRTFQMPPVARTGPAAGPAIPFDEDESAGDSVAVTVPAWVNVWALAGCVATALALLIATLTGVYWLSLVLSIAGVALVLWGVLNGLEIRRSVDRVWFYAAGSAAGLVLFLILFLPGVLNGWWSIDVAPPKRDPHALVVVPRDEPLEDGKPLSGDGANAETEGIRQDDVFVRLESIKIGRVPKRGPGSYFLVHFRLTGVGSGETIKFEGFSAEAHRPVLTGDGGKSYAFVEQQKRKVVPGPLGKEGKLVFEESPAQATDVVPPGLLDLVLVFDSAPPRFESVNLELPASAWGRSGVCRFRIAGPFDARVLK
jgi:hypothetical protein